MYSKAAIELKNISKSYKIYQKPLDRLVQMFPWNKHKKMFEEFVALNDINLSIQKGEVIGVVGQNGAGKSTLLQIVCQTLQPSSGTIAIDGKISALLELGSGFNPEFSGRENVYMSAAIAGLSLQQTDAIYASIVEFSGIGEHIDHPVKTYSSGMMMRLAFAVATSVEPDILVIDEALSVGDGAFARKSFDRIMKLKESDCTILFCSHSLYQVEVLCQKVMWIDKGEVKAFGEPSGVINSYQKYLDNIEIQKDGDPQNIQEIEKTTLNASAKIKKAVISSDDQTQDLQLISDVSTLKIETTIQSDPTLPTPSVAVIITDEVGRNVTSCGSYYDQQEITMNDCEGTVCIEFPKLGLRRGRYYVYVFLLCENAVHIYESVQCGTLEMTQKGSEIGIVSLPRTWK